MQKFKIYAKKYLLKACITSLVSVFLCISFFIPSSAAETIQSGIQVYYNLDDLFDGASGDFIYTIADAGGMPSGLRSDSGYFRSKNLFPGGAATIQGNLNLIPGMFSTELYYKFSIPLSFYVGGLSVATVKLSFIDNDGNEHVFSQEFLRPDPLNISYVTAINELVLSGKQLQSVNKFKLSVYGSGWEASGYPRVYLFGGLLNGRSFSISSITQYQYDTLYGDKDYNIETGDIIARVDAIENELFDKADLGSISESVFGSLTWFADISPGIMSAGMIVDELLNFGGINNTWMMNVVRFALLLGCTALILAIGPGVISKFSSSEREEGYIRRRKGDD